MENMYSETHFMKEKIKSIKLRVIPAKDNFILFS